MYFKGYFQVKALKSTVNLASNQSICIDNVDMTKSKFHMFIAFQAKWEPCCLLNLLFLVIALFIPE